MSILCLVAARGGSVGVRDKNTRPLLGKPLIAWTIEQALAVAEIERVVVSTDDVRIAKAARAAGAETPFVRPAELAGPTTGKLVVWQHALQACEEHYGTSFDTFLDLDCTSPLRDPEDIAAALRQFRDGRACGVDGVISVCNARRNPYFNMVEVDGDGALRVSKPAPVAVLRRQDAPQVLDIVGSIYVLDAGYLRSTRALLEGRIQGYDIGQAKGIDIDSELDFRIVEVLMRERKSLPA